MGYGIHIERDPPLTLSEWKSAVMATDGVRLNSAGASITNPSTSEVISMKGTDGDAEAFANGQWSLCFLWRPDGEVVFDASDGFENSSDPLRIIARKLATRLNAVMTGDEGEQYA